MTVNGEVYEYDYDSLGRLIKRRTSIDAEDETVRPTIQVNYGKYEEYTYVAGAASGTTTTLVKTFRDLLGVLHTYTYDKNGNITFEKIGEGDDVEYKSYLYDEHNRMTRYNDSELGVTITYTYDDRGNITNYTIYEYSAYTNPVNTSTAYAYNYLYKDETWKDLATSIHGKSIAYDEIGNPENWLYGKTFTWENGRQLAKIEGGTDVDYTYNGDGLRLSKSGDRNTEYIVVDGTYIGERTTINGVTYLITYIYGSDGSVMGLDVNGTAYYFVKNLQGDVTAIINATGTVIAKYAYDAYGFDMGITDANGTAITADTHIAHLNPFRYRGYMYDEETGFYYLRSRYYDPEVGRFLNADGMVSTGTGLNGYNMFAYCDGNPVVLVDSSGTRPIASCTVNSETATERTISCAFMNDLSRKKNNATSAILNYSDYLDALGERESSNDYTAVNQYGYLGRYQMGKVALQDAGFKDTSGNWTEMANSYGVYSTGDFLNSSKAQDVAITEFNKKQCSYIKNLGLDSYIGSQYCGVTVTESGLLAACHLVGVGNIKKALASGAVVWDGNGVHASEYMELFGGYDISEVW